MAASAQKKSIIGSVENDVLDQEGDEEELSDEEEGLSEEDQADEDNRLSLVNQRNEKKRSRRQRPPGPNSKAIIVRASMADFRKLTGQVEQRRRSFEREAAGKG